MVQKLFLLGGSPAYPAYADEFTAAAGGKDARIAVLVQTRPGWEKYGSEISQPWQERGVTKITAVTPNEQGLLDVEAAVDALQRATGIFICGGKTPVYHRLYASEPLGAVIREKYAAGTPVAGVSAGALLSLEICQFTAEETGGTELEIARGLGLARGFAIGVHYSEWNSQVDVLEVMAKTRTPIAYGIDEPACLVCEDGLPARALGKSVWRIEMDNFEQKVNRVVPGFDPPPTPTLRVQCPEGRGEKPSPDSTTPASMFPPLRGGTEKGLPLAQTSANPEGRGKNPPPAPPEGRGENPHPADSTTLASKSPPLRGGTGRGLPPVPDIVLHQPVKPEKLAFAKRLRREMTAAEARLWQRLRAGRLGGFHFHRQRVIGRYIADFYCARAGLVIEVDGDSHAGQEEYDRERQAQLEARGLRVIRFTNDEIHQQLDAVLFTIMEACYKSANP